ncbi:MAG: PAS domain S-box protein [Phycisphaerales bacterium]|nr:MAG: PAS domain S-box protein [Phycisphaerales bacterium]
MSESKRSAAQLEQEVQRLHARVAELEGALADHENAQIESRESEERFRIQFQSIPIPTYTWQKDGDDFKLAAFNDAAMAMTRGKLADSLGVNARKFFAGRRDIVDKLARCAAEQGTYREEMRFRLRSTGEERDLAVDYTFVPPNLVMVHTQDITEQRRAQEALRESEERLRLALSAAATGTWRWDPSSNQDTRDANFNRILGLDAVDSTQAVEDFLGRVHPDDRGAVEEAIKRSIDRKEPYLAEFRIVRPDGVIRWLRGQGDVFCDSTGRITHMTGAVVDVTDRRRTEEALVSSEERFRAIAENLPGAVFSYDVDGEGRRSPVYVGPGFEELIGQAATDRIKDGDVDHFFELIHPEDLERLRGEGQFRPAFAKLVDHEYRLRTETGEYRWVRVVAQPVRLQGSTLRWHGVLIDVTEGKLAEQRVAASERRYRELYEGSRDGYALVDMQGKILECNTTIRQMVGYTTEELLDMTYEELTAKKWHEHEQRIVREQVLPRGYSDVFEKEYRRKDGTVVPVELRVYLLRNGDGTPAGMWAFVRDITERKAAEAARRRLEVQLRHAHKLQAVGQLAAGVAHDFNSLLAVVLGNAELLSSRLASGVSDGNGEVSAGLVAQIMHAVERGQSLVHKLLMFGRARVWKVQLLDLNKVVSEAQEMLETVLGNSIRFEVRPAPDLRRFCGDAAQIEQVIMNLVLNARDAMHEGGELLIETANVDLNELTAAAHPQASSGSYVMITVRDTGEGIAKDVLDRVFEPFFSTKPVDKGTGLGLSIVHGIVENAGGHIELDSTPGRGTTFRLYFPAAR